MNTELVLTSMMLFRSPICVLAAATAVTAIYLPAPSLSATGLPLNITALTARDGKSVLECWQLNQRFAETSVPGTQGALNLKLGNLTDVSYTIIPSNFDGGMHNAPESQLIWFISGLAHIILPESEDEVWVQGGKYGFIAATDTADVSEKGHITTYPGMADTIALQMPLPNFSSKNYTLLHQNPCTPAEMAAL